MEELKKIVAFCLLHGPERIMHSLGLSLTWYARAVIIIEKLVPEAYHLVNPNTFDNIYQVALGSKEDQLAFVKVTNELDAAFKIDYITGVKKLVSYCRENPEYKPDHRPGLFPIMESIADNLIPEAYWIMNEKDLESAYMLSRLSRSSQLFAVAAFKELKK